MPALRSGRTVMDSEVSTESGMLARPLKRQRRPAKRFVGDVLQIVPPEIADNIFAYCDPGDIFRLRNVSRLWNEYLSRPEVLQRMDMEMYADGGQYQSRSDKDHAEDVSFEDRVRSRCAILNANAYSFDHVYHKCRGALARQFCSGVLLDLADDCLTIYVKRLCENDADWFELRDYDGMAFELVKLTPKHVLAVTTHGTVYCWCVTTFEEVAVFDILFDEEATFDPLPYTINASANTILMYSGNDVHGERYMYSIDTDIMRQIPTFYLDDRSTYSIDQSGYLYRCKLESIPEHHIEVFKINDTRTEIEFIEYIDVYYLGLEQLDRIRCQKGLKPLKRGRKVAFNAVVVWNHKCYYLYNKKPSERACLVFELKDGIATYHHTMYYHCDQGLYDLAYLPQLGLAFKSEYGTNGVPLGIFQIRGKKYRPLKPGRYKGLLNYRTRAGTEYALEIGEDIDWGRNFGVDSGTLYSDGKFLICTPTDGLLSRVWRLFPE